MLEVKVVGFVEGLIGFELDKVSGVGLPKVSLVVLVLYYPGAVGFEELSLGFLPEGKVLMKVGQSTSDPANSLGFPPYR